MNWKNEITAALHIDYCIVQAPMLGVTTPQMVAEIANAGGLGSLPVGGLSPEKTRELIHQTKALTTKPFAVNLFVHDIPEPQPEEVRAMKTFLLRLCKKHELPFTESDFTPFRHYSYREQISILLQEKICSVSFTFGIPDEDSIAAMKNAGIVLMGTATCLGEALILDAKGIDIIIAQGMEAGGHRGSFMKEEPLPQVTLLPLLTSIIESTKKPVIAAGAICDGKTIKTVMDMGAKAVQIGTAFIASPESAAIPSYKDALQHAGDTDSTLTRAFSGRWARGLRNSFIQEVEDSGIIIPGYPIQNSLTGQIRALAQKLNNNQLTNMWAGQSASKAEAKPTAVIFKELVKKVEDLGE